MKIDAKIHPIYEGKKFYATDGSAAIDLRAVSVNSTPINETTEFTLPVGETCTVGTGLYVDLGSYPFVRLAMLILPRSGLGCKGLKPANSPGLIDSDYQGEIKVCLTNQGEKAVSFKGGDRIAQAMFVPTFHVGFNHVEAFATRTERGEGGFGSTGA